MFDYYEILQVSPNADPEVIQAAYRRLTLKYHPDRNVGDESADKTMRLLNEAYAIISDPALRQQYDNERRAGHQVEQHDGMHRNERSHDSSHAVSPAPARHQHGIADWFYLFFTSPNAPRSAFADQQQYEEFWSNEATRGLHQNLWVPKRQTGALPQTPGFLEA